MKGNGVFKIPKWRRDALNKLHFRRIWLWLLTLGVMLGVGLLCQFMGLTPVPWILLLVISFVITSILATSEAYSQGLRDGRAHPNDTD